MSKSEEEECKLKINTTPTDLSRSEISDTEKEFKRKTYWKSCCLTIDRRAVQFFSQLSISLIIIVFCLFQLHTKPKCDTGEYLSLLTMVLGMWIDAPRLEHK
jgi:hypothetical protein